MYCMDISIRNADSHVDVCLWHSGNIVFAAHSHNGEGAAKVLFSSPHEGTLIQLDVLGGDSALITYSDFGICLCL